MHPFVCVGGGRGRGGGGKGQGGAVGRRERKGGIRQWVVTRNDHCPILAIGVKRLRKGDGVWRRHGWRWFSEAERTWARTV